jgi:hypothetical protein
MPTLMEDPTHSWLKPENASVLDSQLVKVLRAIVNANPWPKPLQGVLPNPNPAAIALDPQSQVLALMGADVPSGGPRIEGWHGSPANFDKFDSKYIGTGEGAQAYGHGLYIAEKEDIAKGYRDRLSGVKGHIPGAATGRGQWMVNGIPPPEGIAGHAALDTAQDLQGLLYYKKHGYADMADVVQPQIERRIATFRAEDAKGYHQGIAGEDMRALADYYDTHVRHATPEMIGARPPGKLYQVAIHADPEHLLDWDKPLSEQSPHVQQALEQLGVSPKPVQPWHAHQITAEDVAKKLVPANYAPGSWISAVRDPAGQIEWHGGQLFGSEAAAAENAAARTAIDQRAVRDKGRELYQDLGAPTKKEASQKLEKAGIPGIKYLDQISRNKGEGSYNYVVFDENRLEILKKLGLLLPAIGAGSQTYGSMFDQSQAVGK